MGRELVLQAVPRDEGDASAPDLADHGRRRWFAERRVDVDGLGRLQEGIEARPPEHADLRPRHEPFFPSELDVEDELPPEELDAAVFSAGFDDPVLSFFSLLESEDPVEAAGFSPDFSPDVSPDLSPDFSPDDFDFFP
jgi:hypothetical protein